MNGVVAAATPASPQTPRREVAAGARRMPWITASPSRQATAAAIAAITSAGMPASTAGAGAALGAGAAGLAGAGAAAVSGLEVCIGLACREVLHIVVWDYSAEWGNLAGLVCPRYCLYWFLLCGWVILVLRAARRFTVRPVYRI